MNDAHIYCTLDQEASEVADNVRMVQDYYSAFGFDDYHFRLSLWDPENTEKYIDQPENWESTQNHLRGILDELGVDYVEAVGEGGILRSEDRHTVHDITRKGGVDVDYTARLRCEGEVRIVLH